MYQITIFYYDLWEDLSCSEIETTLLYLSSVRSTVGSQQLN